MAKKKLAVVPPPQPRSRRVDLLPDDIVRLSEAKALFLKRLGLSKLSEVDTMRMLWREGAIRIGIESGHVEAGAEVKHAP